MVIHNDRKRFDLLKNVRIPFGKHKGRTLNEIATDDEGLLYLDWLAGQDWMNDPRKWADVREGLEAFLGYEVVARDLEDIMARRQQGASRR